MSGNGPLPDPHSLPPGFHAGMLAAPDPEQMRLRMEEQSVQVELRGAQLSIGVDWNAGVAEPIKLRAWHSPSMTRYTFPFNSASVRELAGFLVRVADDVDRHQAAQAAAAAEEVMVPVCSCGDPLPTRTLARMHFDQGHAVPPDTVTTDGAA